MEQVVHIRKSKKIYYGTIILCILFNFHQSLSNNLSFSKTISSNLGIISVLIMIFSVYKIIFSKGNIILTEQKFKVGCSTWIEWKEFSFLYSTTEEDSENGPRHFFNFQLTDGTTFSIRSESLDMSFEQIAGLINEYKTNYSKSQHTK